MGHDEHRLKHLEAQMRTFENTLAGLSSEFHSVKISMNANTEALKEYIELSKNLKVGMKFLGYVERTAVWVAKVGGGIGIIWLSWKFVILETLNRIRQ